MRCPTCQGAELEQRMIRESVLGVDLGEVMAEVCPACGETLTDEAATLELERRAKAAGVWGMGRRLTLEQEGDDLVLHIPSDLVRHLKLTRGKRLAVHLEGTERIVVELEG